MGITKLLQKNTSDAFDKVRTKNKKMSTINFYIELLFSLIAQGNIDKPDTTIPEGYFYYATNKIFTTDKVMKVIFISELPMFIDKNFLTNLRNDVLEFGELRVIELIEPYEFNRDSWRVKNRIQMWHNRAKYYEESIRNKSSIDEIFEDRETKEFDERTERMIRSWNWVNKAEENKLEFCKYTIALELIADDLKNLYEMEKKVKRRLKLLNVYFKDIFVQTNEYYKIFAPCGGKKENMLTKTNPPTILTDYELSQLCPNVDGLVGDTTGVYFGTNVFTGLPIMYDLKKGTDAINFLLTAATGGGKSNFAKGLLTHFKINRISTIILDYEGDEYQHIGVAHGAKFVNMNPEVSYYFDTTEIGDLTGDEKIDRGLKDDAIATTKLVFDVLTDYQHGMNAHELSLFNDMILRVYERKGVTDDPQTWKNSKGCCYEDLYRELFKMREEEKYANMQPYIDDFITKLRLYFDGNIYSNLFKNRLSINDLLGHDMIIFSFGMRGRSENTIDERSLSLRQLFVGYLIQLICNYNKSVLNKVTVIVLEELQRYLNHQSSGQIVNDIVTGGRKRGAVTFLITNSPLQIVDTSNMSGNDALANHAKAIKNNITGFIIGKLQEGTWEQITSEYKMLKGCENELIAINTDNTFKYCFLLHFKGENSVVKFEIPPSLVDSVMYKTRVEQED